MARCRDRQSRRSSRPGDLRHRRRGERSRRVPAGSGARPSAATSPAVAIDRGSHRCGGAGQRRRRHRGRGTRTGCPVHVRPVRVASYQHARLPRRPRRGSQRRSRHRSGRALPAEVPPPAAPRGQVSRFAGACGMAWVGASSGQWRTTIFVSERIRVSGAGHHRLPVRLLDRTRGYAVAHLVIDGWQPLTAVSLHLSLRPEERQRHAGAILAALADQPGALVVAGDLNELNDGAAHRAFAQGLRVVSGSVPTYSSRAPRKALDVIFATPHLKVVATRHRAGRCRARRLGPPAGVGRPDARLGLTRAAGTQTREPSSESKDHVPWERAGPAARSRARSRRCRRAATRWRGTAGRRRHRETMTGPSTKPPPPPIVQVLTRWQGHLWWDEAPSSPSSSSSSPRSGVSSVIDGPVGPRQTGKEDRTVTSGVRAPAGAGSGR